MLLRQVLLSRGRSLVLRFSNPVPTIPKLCPRYFSHDTLTQSDTSLQETPIQTVTIQEEVKKVEEPPTVPVVKKVKKLEVSLEALKSQYELLPVKFPVNTIDLIYQFDKCAKRKVGWTIFLPSMQKEILTTVVNDFPSLGDVEVGLLLIGFGKMGVQWKDFPRKLQQIIQQRIRKITDTAQEENNKKKQKQKNTRFLVSILRDLLRGLSSLHYYDQSLIKKSEETEKMMESIHEFIQIVHDKKLFERKSNLRLIPDIFNYYFSLSSSTSSSSSPFQWNLLDSKTSEFFLSLLQSYIPEKFSSQKYQMILHSLAKARAPIEDFPDALKAYLESGMSRILLNQTEKKAEVINLLIDLYLLQYPFTKLKIDLVMDIIKSIDKLKKTLSPENFVKIVSILPYLSFDMKFEEDDDEENYKNLLKELVKIYHHEHRISSKFFEITNNSTGVASFFAYLRTFPQSIFTVRGEDWRDIPLPLLVSVSQPFYDDELSVTFARELRHTWEKKFVEAGSLPDVRFVPEKDLLDCGVFVAPVSIERGDEILATILFEDHEPTTEPLSREEQFREFLYGKYQSNIQIWRINRSKVLNNSNNKEIIEDIIDKIEQLTKKEIETKTETEKLN